MYEHWSTLCWFLAAYTLGSFPTAAWLARLGDLPDPQKYGSKNPGASNVARLAGLRWGALVLAIDLGKGALAVALADRFAPHQGATALLAVIIGHMFSVMLKFNGGKGVATTVGAWLIFCPPVAISALVGWGIAVGLTQISALGALVIIAALPSWVLMYAPKHLLLSVCLSALMAWRHQGNWQQLRTALSSSKANVRPGD